MATYQQMFEDEDLFDRSAPHRKSNEFSSWFGSNQSDEQRRLERIVQRADQTIPERFVADVKAFYIEHRIRYTDETWNGYEQIARKYGRANFLNPAACVLAVRRALDRDMRVRPETFKDPSLLEECAEHDVTILDVVRYAELIQLLFTI